jgi:hypothetical protein
MEKQEIQKGFAAAMNIFKRFEEYHRARGLKGKALEKQVHKDMSTLISGVAMQVNTVDEATAKTIGSIAAMVLHGVTTEPNECIDD